jgi:cytochrome P450
MSSFAGPPPLSSNPLRKLAADLLAERAIDVPFPPGETTPNLRRTQRFALNPLPLLLDAYERYGPVFTLRIFHSNSVFMLGPEANHYMTVSHASNFSWREGHMGDLIPFLGDGLLTIDGDFHRRSRRVMLPAFHHERVARAIEVMTPEIDRALEGWREGERVDIYGWTRRLAMRIAMRALFGLDPDGAAGRINAAALFEQALSFYSRDYFLQILRGPRTPYARMQRARAELDAVLFEEIRRRRATGERGEDILSLLLDAHDEDGNTLSDRQIRDEVMTLMFAGHDTTTSTIAFMFYELAHHPEIAARLLAEQDAQPGGAPNPSQLLSGGLVELEMVLDETLRKYPPAWVGPRRAIEAFEFEGRTVPARAFVNYCSWASHHLPDVFPEPERFRPERFTPEGRTALAKGAYVPFGGGSRTCIGMRFGQLEVRTIASLILARFTLSLPEDFKLTIRQMPTISPKHGLPMLVHARAAAPTQSVPATA